MINHGNLFVFDMYMRMARFLQLSTVTRHFNRTRIPSTIALIKNKDTKTFSLRSSTSVNKDHENRNARYSIGDSGDLSCTPQCTQVVTGDSEVTIDTAAIKLQDDRYSLNIVCSNR